MFKVVQTVSKSRGWFSQNRSLSVQIKILGEKRLLTDLSFSFRTLSEIHLAVDLKTEFYVSRERFGANFF